MFDYNYNRITEKHGQLVWMKPRERLIYLMKCRHNWGTFLGTFWVHLGVHFWPILGCFGAHFGVHFGVHDNLMGRWDGKREDWPPALIHVCTVKPKETTSLMLDPHGLSALLVNLRNFTKVISGRAASSLALLHQILSILIVWTRAARG